MSTLDVGDAAGAAQIVARAQALAPLGGVFHLAMIPARQVAARPGEA